MFRFARITRPLVRYAMSSSHFKQVCVPLLISADADLIQQGASPVRRLARFARN